MTPLNSKLREFIKLVLSAVHATSANDLARPFRKLSFPRSGASTLSNLLLPDQTLHAFIAVLCPARIPIGDDTLIITQNQNSTL